LATEPLKTDKGNRKNPTFGQFPISERLPASRTTYCRLVVFHYTRQNFGTASSIRNNLVGPPVDESTFDINQFTIEEEIFSVTTSKSLDKPAGTFNISLFPTQNWKEKISPGDWVCIYFYNQLETGDSVNIDTRNLIMLGNVDRVSRNLNKNEDDDKIQLRYEVAGRNFGKAFEDMNIWFDPYANQENILDVALRTAGLEFIGNPTKQVSQLLDVFMGPGASFSTGKTTPLRQFRIPKELSNLFGVANISLVKDERGFTLEAFEEFAISKDEPVLYDIINKNIEPGLPGFRARNVISAEDNGNLWENIQRASNDIVNEVYLEEVRQSDGSARPTIVLRPRPINTPFFDEQFGNEIEAKDALNGKFKTLQNLADDEVGSYVQISGGEILFENLGKDDHSRFNMFWILSNRAQQHLKSIYSNLRGRNIIGNPFVQRESVNRYGLKKFHKVYEFDMVSSTSVKGGEPQSAVKLFKAFMVQLYDQNFANHLYETGTIETTGVLEAELGKALRILPDKGASTPERIFYIQGYEHEWKFQNTWRTTFSVTHGQFKTDDSNIFIDVIDDNRDFGKQDSDFDSTYIAKTETKNKDSVQKKGGK